jgi:hypothetical protein
VVRILVRRDIPHSLWIEDHDIRLHPFSKDAAVTQARAAGRQGSHLANGFLEGDESLLANVFAEDAREGSVGSRVGAFVALHYGAGVGADGHPRLLQRVFHVVFAQRKEDCQR